MIDAMAGRMAAGIKKRSPEHPASLEVLKHSLAILINTFSIMVLSLVIGLVTRRVSEVIVVLVAFALLRMVSGGLHLKSGTWCVIVTTLGVSVLSQVALIPVIVAWITTISLVLAAIFSPTDLRKQSRISVRFYPLLKVISVVMVASNYFFSSSTIAVSFLLQTLLLIPWKVVDNK
ncbi:accessory regulator AgrB [Paenibacillus sp. LMG 31459]|uniref:Accessory regulator AgrB n=1 Tax=Paenibacillus phytohabitans TaxID=2654978 RepID=A0ABX1YKF2_9BACL|nr:accessory gene regulator B family protein [Paenibacillus phytohabitans]NOU80601.1 accessory regulator AgrB [Paenibacillus phytohabitans]